MSKKEKLLIAAQKLLQKGQVARAVKEYQKIVELDPRDVRSRQKLADLCSRASMIPEALEAYGAVAKYYVDNGFHLKAIAVYKQMQKLDPSQVEIYHSLAELNRSQGLIGNALAEYRHLVTLYESQKKIPETIRVLEKMKDLDPGNLNIRVKAAEIYAYGGRANLAGEEFLAVLKGLQRGEDAAKVAKLYTIFRSLGLDEVRVHRRFVEAYFQTGQLEAGLRLIQELRSRFPGDAGLLETLAAGYRRAGNHASEQKVFLDLLKLQPEHLDYRAGLIQAFIDGGDFSRSLAELENHRPAFVAAKRLSFLKQCYEALEQVRPVDAQVRSALQEVYELTGDGDKLFGILSTAPEPADLADDALDVAEISLDDLFLGSEEQALSPVAADRFPAAEEPIEPMASTAEWAAAADPLPSLEPELLEPETEIELELELDLGDPFAEEAVSGAGGAHEANAAGAEPMLLEPPSADAELDDLLDLDLGEAFAAEDDAAPVVDLGSSLEEAEFYAQQGLTEEALRVYREILSRDAGCAVARERLQALQGPGASSTSAVKSAALADMSSEEIPPPVPEEPPVAGAGAPAAQTPVDEEEAESHYSLGIAYKEMGLLDEAIAEFDQARQSPLRSVAALVLKGTCLTQQGAFEAAEEALQAGLSHAGLTAEEACCLHYEMGLLYESWDRRQEALARFELVAATDGGFCEVAEKLHQLRSGDVLSKTGGKRDRVSYI